LTFRILPLHRHREIYTTYTVYGLLVIQAQSANAAKRVGHIMNICVWIQVRDSALRCTGLKPALGPAAWRHGHILTYCIQFIVVLLRKLQQMKMQYRTERDKALCPIAIGDGNIT
jgi:hypothetical protein